MTITAQEELDQYIDKIGLTIGCKFKPWDEKSDACLRWDVTLKHRGQIVLTCEYTAGIAHCPSYPAYAAYDECVTGQGPRSNGMNGKPILPHTHDVIQSVCLDASALDYGSFEDWARNYGYDTDSRKAEKMYRQCLQHGIALRSTLGSETFDHLCHLASQL